MMAEIDDVERYRKLLEDWKPGPPATKKTSYTTSSSTVSPMAYTHQKPAALDKVAQDRAPYGTGAILRLNGHTLAIYKKAVPEKGYHLMLILGPGGSVKAQGISLDGYEVEELGSIAPKWFAKLENDLRWERDLIVFHCYSYEDVAKVPRAEGVSGPRENNVRPAAPQPRAEQPEAEPATAEEPVGEQPQASQAPAEPRQQELNGNLRRGQRLQIKFGNNTWMRFTGARTTRGR
jgi:hypothetical protein